MKGIRVGTLVEAGAGDISDPIIEGTVEMLGPPIVVLWKARAWYTTGHKGLKFGPLRRFYSKDEFNQLLISQDYDGIRVALPPRPVKRCPTCHREID